LDLCVLKTAVLSADDRQDSTCEFPDLIQKCSTRGIANEPFLAIWVSQKTASVRHVFQVWRL
jgi:hypothetical protein